MTCLLIGDLITSPPQLSSVSCVDTSNGVHHFEIHNYSLTKGRGFGTNILSKTFTVGEHDWRIKCYLDGDIETSSDYISVFLSVVAASSPVFRAHISSMFKEVKEPSIKITDIETPVFEALLLYIYTDNLPEIETLTDTGMAQHLLVAADRFALVKLKRSCVRDLM
ncbi:BTB/POZ and MATH domain-containing protein 1-like [Carex rostrata]